VLLFGASYIVSKGYIFVYFIEPAQSQSARTGKWRIIGYDFLHILKNENHLFQLFLFTFKFYFNLGVFELIGTYLNIYFTFHG